MSATITWSTFRTSAGHSASTAVAVLQSLYDVLVAQAADSSFVWEVCSSDLAHATIRYVCVKRKDGSAGRIVFFATNATWTYNQLLGNAGGTTVATNRFLAVYFPAATSDTPANISGSGDVFTGTHVNWAGMGGGNAHFSVSSAILSISASSAGLVLTGISSAAAFQGVLIVGDLLESADGTEILPVTYANNSLQSLSAVAAIPSSVTATYGAYTRNATDMYFFGYGAKISDLPVALNRDDSTKKAWFYPCLMYSAQLPRADRHKYQLRQIAFPQIAPLTVPEYMYGPSATLMAMNNHASNYWLTNFKFTP